MLGGEGAGHGPCVGVVSVVAVLESNPRAAVQVPPGVRRSAGWWRLAAAGPAVAGSAVLVLIACALLADYPAAAFAPLALWAGRAAAALSFRAPRRDQAALLGPAVARVLAAAGVKPGWVDFYVRPGRQVNTFAAGGRSVAISERAVKDFAARRHSQVVIEALLAHELGHLTVPGSRFGVAAMWLAWPWRAVSRLVLGVCWGIAGGRRQSGRLVGLVAGAGVVIAVVQMLGQQQWPGAVCLAALAVCAIGSPLLAAAGGRAGESAADAFAAACGYGPALARALANIVPDPAPVGWVGRLLADHPDTGLRIHDLTTAGR